MTLAAFLTLYGISFMLLAAGVGMSVILRRRFTSRQHNSFALNIHNWYAVLVFQVLFPIGLVIFAAYPAAGAGKPVVAFFLGALFGFFVSLAVQMSAVAAGRLRSYTIAALLVMFGAALSSVVAGLAAYVYTI